MSLLSKVSRRRLPCVLAAVGLLPCGWAATSVAATCEPSAKTVFSCRTRAGKEIQVCDSGRTIDYAFGRPTQKPELVIRAARATASTVQWLGIGRSMSYSVEIPNRDVKYTVYWAVDRLDEEHPIDAGVMVERNGKQLARVRCLDDDKLIQNIEGIDLKKSE